MSCLAADVVGSLRGARLSEHLTLDYKGVSGPELEFCIAVPYGNAETVLFFYVHGLCEAGVFRKSRRAGSEPIVTRLTELRAHLARHGLRGRATCCEEFASLRHDAD